MFDAKSLLEALVKGAAPQAAPAQAGGGLGGLGDILGKMMQPGGGAGGGAGGLGGLGDILGKLGGPAAGGASHGRPAGGEAAASQGAGLEDLLRNLFPGAGGPPQGQPHAQPAAPEAGAGGGAGGGLGGLGDILGKLGGPGGAAGGLGDLLGKLQKGTVGSGGGSLTDILGQVLGQATQGARDGATRIGEATGARDALGKATGGLSGDDILAKLKDLVQQNQLGAGAAVGGLGGLVLGTKAGRAMAGSAIKLGALALIGGLAYQAIQNYQQGKPALTGADAFIPQQAPDGSGFEPEAVTNETAALYIRAMIAAAAADGRIDAAEQAKIMGGLNQAGIGADARAFLQNELNNPATAADLAAGCKTPEQAVQVFTAARFAIELDEQGEADFLNELAGALGLDANLAQHIDATARSASAAA